MISIVVPAHNEANVIERCLRSMTTGAQPGELEILVVCNGCTDDTAAIAAAFGPPVRVLDCPVASKQAALNLGHATASGYPRFFVDADIELPIDSIRRVADVLRGGEIHGAAPRIRVDLAKTSWPVRAYYDIWLRTPYVAEGMLGSGVYAISEEGARRFDAFPDIISDDGFVRLLFKPSERQSVDGSHFVMTPPRTLRSQIHVNVRRRAGRFEMAALHPGETRAEAATQRFAVARLARDPRRWPGLAVYAFAKAASVLLYRWKALRGRQKEWNRDDSSRAPAGG
ncbi:MAG: glycosyltransferase [Myxococcota bacterium]